MLLFFVLAVWQAVVVARTAGFAETSAHSAARAVLVGHDPLDAARRALPPDLAAGMKLRRGSDGSVQVRVAVPAVMVDGSLTTVDAAASATGAGR